MHLLLSAEQDNWSFIFDRYINDVNMNVLQKNRFKDTSFEMAFDFHDLSFCAQVETHNAIKSSVYTVRL